MTTKFRPQQLSSRWKLVERRRGSHASMSFNFQSRSDWFPAGWTTHQCQFARRFGRLHYLACHAPLAVQRRWRHAYQNFMACHFAHSGQASARYLSVHTCHRWL